MNARELIVRINDLEARVAELEGTINETTKSIIWSGEMHDIDGDLFREIHDRLQSMEDWRQTFERPARDKLQIRPMTAKAEVGGYQPGTKR